MRKKTNDRRPNGFFDSMNDKDILEYCFDNHGREITRTRLYQEDSYLYRIIKDRGLLEQIIRKIRPGGFFVRMDDLELLSYCFRIHSKNISPKELAKRDSGLYKEIENRGLLERLKTKGRRFAKMTDEELLQYCFATYGYNVTSGRLSDRDPSLHALLCSRGIINEIITVRRRFAKMTDEELLQYCFNKYGKKIVSRELRKMDKSLYQVLSRRELLGSFKRQRQIYTANREWVIFEGSMKKAIKENRGEFPTYGRLIELRYGFLTNYISFYGGMAAVREKIGYNQQVRIKLARQLEEIADQVAA